ncbi:MAG: LPS export ABC transporter periplasmic protein LptC [Gemmatimonadota bacterium]
MIMRYAIPLVTLALVGGCGTESTTPSADTQAFDLQSDQVATDVTQVLTRNGVRTALLRSDSTYIQEGDRRLDLVGVNMTFYNDNGSSAGTLTSRSGDYDMANRAFIATGDVVLVTEGPNGERRLETEELHYDVENDEIWTEEPFTLHDDGRVSSGTSFRSDSQLRIWEVTGGQTQGTVEGEGGLSF